MSSLENTRKDMYEYIAYWNYYGSTGRTVFDSDDLLPPSTAWERAKAAANREEPGHVVTMVRQRVTSDIPKPLSNAAQEFGRAIRKATVDAASLKVNLFVRDMNGVLIQMTKENVVAGDA